MSLNKKVMLTCSVVCAIPLCEKNGVFSSEHCILVFCKKYLESSVKYVSKSYLNYVKPFYILTEFNLFNVYPNVEI